MIKQIVNSIAQNVSIMVQIVCFVGLIILLISCVVYLTEKYNQSDEIQLNNVRTHNYYCERVVTIERVIDGDTVVTDEGEKIRMAGIDAPEIGEKGAEYAANFTEKMIGNKSVCIDVDDSRPRDKYNRTLAMILLENRNTLNKLMIEKGLARIAWIAPSEFHKFTVR